jgi:hypothetical protein
VPPKTNEKVRVEVAFESGQSVGMLIPGAAADALVKALAGEEATFELETDDGTYVLALKKIVYLRRSSRETQIGFGSA